MNHAYPPGTIIKHIKLHVSPGSSHSNHVLYRSPYKSYNMYLSGWHPHTYNILQYLGLTKASTSYNACITLYNMYNMYCTIGWRVSESSESLEWDCWDPSRFARLCCNFEASPWLCSAAAKVGHWMSWCHGLSRLSRLSSRRKTWCWFPLGACRHCSTKPPREPPASIAMHSRPKWSTFKLFDTPWTSWIEQVPRTS